MKIGNFGFSHPQAERLIRQGQRDALLVRKNTEEDTHIEILPPGNINYGPNGKMQMPLEKGLIVDLYAE